MSQASNPDQETLALLREQLRENPRAIIRKYPDKAREIAQDARQAGKDALAEKIERLVAEVQEEST